jgi:hypothetical protein
MSNSVRKPDDPTAMLVVVPNKVCCLGGLDDLLSFLLSQCFIASYRCKEETKEVDPQRQTSPFSWAVAGRLCIEPPFYGTEIKK